MTNPPTSEEQFNLVENERKALLTRHIDAYEQVIDQIRRAQGALQMLLHFPHPDADITTCLNSLEVRLLGYQSALKRFELLGR